MHLALFVANFMEEYGLNQTTLTRGLGVPCHTIGQLLRQKRGLSFDMAVRLGTFFGDGPIIWMNLQRDYEMDVAEEKGVLQIIRASVKPVDIADKGHFS